MNERKLHNLDDVKLANAEARQKFEKALTNLDEEFKTWTDTIHDSERLSEDDFAIYINV